MATNDEKTRDDYLAELALLGEKLVDPSINPALKIPQVPCVDVLLAQATDDGEVKAFYDQYFAKFAHIIFTPEERAIFDCTETDDDIAIKGAMTCLPPSCTTLFGLRGSASYIATPTSKINRLYIGDVLWAYWIDRMGLFEMLTKLVNDYAIEGRFPIANNNPIANPIHNYPMTPVTLEIMARQFQMGIASLTRDRVSTYRRCLGWTTPTGRKMNIQTEVNTAFNSQFHLFIKTALEYYKDLRLAQAIRQTVGGGSSASTRVAVAEALQLLKESFGAFAYGRNNFNTLNAIVYAIAAMDMIRTLRDYFGVPRPYTKPSQYVSAAYAILIEGKSASTYKPNRYLLHKDCAEKGRDLLLDIDVLDADDVDAVGTWLENKIVEEKIETYRKAYRDITKIDLAESIQNIEQQA